MTRNPQSREPTSPGVELGLVGGGAPSRGQGKARGCVPGVSPSLVVCLEQCFVSRTVVPSGGHLAASGDLLGCHIWKGAVGALGRPVGAGQGDSPTARIAQDSPRRGVIGQEASRAAIRRDSFSSLSSSLVGHLFLRPSASAPWSKAAFPQVARAQLS